LPCDHPVGCHKGAYGAPADPVTGLQGRVGNRTERERVQGKGREGKGKGVRGREREEKREMKGGKRREEGRK